MPGIKNIRLVDARVLVGPKFEQVDGYGDDKFSLVPTTDEGLMVEGCDGDVMFVERVVRGWNLEFTFLTAAAGIDLILGLARTLKRFELKVEYGDFNFVGWMNLRNRGALAAGIGATNRTIACNAAYVSGNVDVAPGETLVVL